ncbi:MAG: Clp protease N-terminal domain-containing protein [Hyphomicrobium aestuarii]|nr:Clp protease N-terminal domain-containing protein [Hyphomicrobium aestuarii]
MAVIVDELRRIPMSQRLVATLALAAEFAHAQHHPDVSLEHLLMALTDDGDAGQVLGASHVDAALLKADVSQFLSGLPSVGHATSIEKLQIAPDLRRILEAAAAAASQGRRREINGAIVLAAIVGDGKSSAAHMLRAQGLTFEEAIKALQRAMAASAPPPQADAEDILATARARVQNRSMPGIAETHPTAGRPAKASPATVTDVRPDEPSAPMVSASQEPAKPPQPVEIPPPNEPQPQVEPPPTERPPQVEPPPAHPPQLRSKIAIDDFRDAMSTELDATDHNAADQGASRTDPVVSAVRDRAPSPVTVEQPSRTDAPFQPPPSEMVTVPWPSETTIQNGPDGAFSDAGFGAAEYGDASKYGDGDGAASAPDYPEAAPPSAAPPTHTMPYDATDSQLAEPQLSYPAPPPILRPQPEVIASPHRWDNDPPREDLIPVERPSAQPMASTPLQRPRPPTPQPGSRWPAPVGPAWQQEPAHQFGPDATVAPPPLPPPVLIDSELIYPAASAAMGDYGERPAGLPDGMGDAAHWTDTNVAAGSFPPPPPLPLADRTAAYRVGPAPSAGTSGGARDHDFGPDLAPLDAYPSPGNADLGNAVLGNSDLGHGGSDFGGIDYDGVRRVGANYDGSSYDGSGYDGSSYDGSGYGGSGYDGQDFARPLEAAANYDRQDFAPQPGRSSSGLTSIGLTSMGLAPGDLPPAPLVETLPHQSAPMAPLTIEGGDTRSRRVPIDQAVAGQLVENVPRRMRAGYPSPVEVRIAKSDARRLLDGIEGAQHYGHGAAAPALSVKLRAPDGGFIIDGLSRETQWIESGFEAGGDPAQWRWTVTPVKSGRRRLQLLIAARTTDAAGAAFDTMLPDQVVEVTLGANYGGMFATALTWSAIAITGGVIARFGDKIYDPMVASVIQLIR